MSKHELDVVVKREGRWWAFEISGLGTGGQAASLAEVDRKAQDAATTRLHVQPEDVTVHLTIKGVESALERWAEARHTDQAARVAQATAAAQRRAVVDELRGQRYSVVDIARLLGITRQRVYQLQKP